MRWVLLAVALLLSVAPQIAHAETLPVRPARPADDVRHESLSESWKVLAFDPATRTWVRIQFVVTPWTDFELWVRKGDGIVHGVGSSGMAITPQSSPGVTMVMQALMGSTPVRGRSGWIEHAMPPFPNA